MHDPHAALQDALCRNCAAALNGPYCSQCGQHARESARSLHVLLHDVWHLLTHVDGRLWSTLVPLLVGPGVLTREYFADHRARFIPPFRLYFIISVVFFGLASLSTGLSGAQRNTLNAEQRAQVLRELSESDAPPVINGTVEAATTFTPQLGTKLCARVHTGRAWLDRRLQSTCTHQLSDQGKSMMHEFGTLVPKMMFVLLPLMALVMLALYHHPQRLYVEHLVFFLHLQSTLFLAMILGLLLSVTADLWPGVGPAASWSGWVLFWYAAWYFLAALHAFYGQGWVRTTFKFLVVVVVYSSLFALSLAATLLLSALVT